MIFQSKIGILRRLQTVFKECNNLFRRESQSLIPAIQSEKSLVSNQDFLNQKRKLSFIVNALGAGGFDAALDLWLSQEIDGKRKLAVVVDSMRTESLLPQIQEDDDSRLRSRNWKIPDRILKDKYLVAICMSMSALVSLDSRYELMLRAYGDLLAVQTSNPQTLVETAGKENRVNLDDSMISKQRTRRQLSTT